MLSYYCAYFRYYYPIEFICAFLNTAANDEDFAMGAQLASKYGFKTILPKFGSSGAVYTFDKENKTISKGVSSVKYLSPEVSDELLNMAKRTNYRRFMDVLYDINEFTDANARQIEVLIKIDYFKDFGNQRELLRLKDLFFNFFKNGKVKQVKKHLLENSPFTEIISNHSTTKTKSGAESKNYVLLNVRQAMRDCEDLIKSWNLPDLSEVIKVKNFEENMGYAGYVSGKEEDRPKLYIKDIYPAKRKKDGALFGYNIITQSIGSGIETRWTIFNRTYDATPVEKGDVILCTNYRKEGQYFTMTGYRKIEVFENGI